MTLKYRYIINGLGYDFYRSRSYGQKVLQFHKASRYSSGR
jgi:hypothetical protein